jgi:hypothetical protein
MMRCLIPFDGVLKWDGVLKLGHRSRPKGDYATYF